MKFSFLFWICIHGIPIEPEVTDPDVVTPEVDNAEVGRLNEVDRLKNAIYAPLMALKRTREDRTVFNNFYYKELKRKIILKIH